MTRDGDAPLVIAVLGTGTMGAAMARRARAVGLDVRVWSLPAEHARGVGAGTVPVDSVAAAVAQADVVLTMLPDADAVASAVGGEGEHLSGVAPGAVWMQSATVGLEGTERLAAVAGNAGIPFVDAPVLGSRAPAEAGELVVLASGPDEALDLCAPVFDAVGHRVVRLGAAGGGTRMKLVTNNWIMGAVAALAETVALAGALDADPSAFLEAISGSALDMGYAQTKGAMMAAGEYPAAMSLRHGAKDARLATEAARAAGLHHEVTAAVAGLMQRGVDLGLGDADMAAAVEAARERAA